MRMSIAYLYEVLVRLTLETRMTQWSISWLARVVIGAQPDDYQLWHRKIYQKLRKLERYNLVQRVGEGPRAGNYEHPPQIWALTPNPTRPTHLSPAENENFDALMRIRDRWLERAS